MMLLSHENVLRFFRVWPKQSQPNANFHDLWAHGAFRCSAVLKDGVVGDVRIVSEKGRDARDVMLGLAKTCMKLKLSFYDFIGDRLGIPGPKIPDLATLVRHAHA